MAERAAALDKVTSHKQVPKLSQSATVKRFLDEYFNYTQYIDVFKCVADLQREKDAGRLAGAFIVRFNNGYPEVVVSRTWGFIGSLEMLERIIQPLAATPQPNGEGTMLDNTLIVYTSDSGEVQHSHGNHWPFLFIGDLGGLGGSWKRT